MGATPTADLVAICKRHILPRNADVVVREPYVPYIPKRWNGFVVLAEAQNLSDTYDEYVSRLKKLSSVERIQRLEGRAGAGIRPWADGSLKLAVEAAFGISADSTARSNAVLWSQVDASGRNKKPSDELVLRSIALWSDLLPLIAPKHIVTSGAIARRVIEHIDGSWKHTPLRLPSRRSMSPVSGMFPEQALLSRFPEVRRVVEAHPDWLEGGYRQNKVFFACHAVCLAQR